MIFYTFELKDLFNLSILFYGKYDIIKNKILRSNKKYIAIIVRYKRAR